MVGRRKARGLGLKSLARTPKFLGGTRLAGGPRSVAALTRPLLAADAASPPTRQDACVRAAVLTGFGGPENLVIQDVPDPWPGAGEVLIAVSAAAVNNTDINTRLNWYGPGGWATGCSRHGSKAPMCAGASSGSARSRGWPDWRTGGGGTGAARPRRTGRLSRLGTRWVLRGARHRAHRQRVPCHLRAAPIGWVGLWFRRQRC